MLASWITTLGLPSAASPLFIGDARNPPSGAYSARYRDSVMCTYAFGSNATIGVKRLAFLDRQMRAQQLPYEKVRAITAPSWWSVPCLSQSGYIGMWLSMLHIWRRARKECQQEWVVLLESDAVLPPKFGSVLTHHRSAFVRSDLVWLDARTGTGAGASGCCTVGVAYRTSVLDRLIENFDPHNKLAYWNGYDQKPKPKVNSPTCLTDWYLGNLADYLHLRSRRLGIVQHPKSESEIALLG